MTSTQTVTEKRRILRRYTSMMTLPTTVMENSIACGQQTAVRKSVSQRTDTKTAKSRWRKLSLTGIVQRLGRSTSARSLGSDGNSLTSPPISPPEDVIALGERISSNVNPLVFYVPQGYVYSSEGRLVYSAGDDGDISDGEIVEQHSTDEVFIKSEICNSCTKLRKVTIPLSRQCSRDSNTSVESVQYTPNSQARRKIIRQSASDIEDNNFITKSTKYKFRNPLQRNMSTVSLPSTRQSDQSDDDSCTANAAIDSSKTTTANEEDSKLPKDEVDYGRSVVTGDTILNMKLRRKKVVKEKASARRYHTEDSDSSTPTTPNYLSPTTQITTPPTSTLSIQPNHSRSKSLQDYELMPCYNQTDKSHYDQLPVKRRSNASELRSDMIKRVSNKPPLVATKSEATLVTGRLSDHCKLSSMSVRSASDNARQRLYCSRVITKHHRSLSAVYDARQEDAMLYGTARGRIERKQHSLGKDCFMLVFNIGSKSDVEVISAIKGQTLRSAILPALEKRSINIDSISVYLSSSKSPLPQNVDIYPLGGNQLNVKSRDVDDPNPTGQKCGLQPSVSNISSTSSTSSISSNRIKNSTATLAAKLGNKPQSNTGDRKYNPKKDGKKMGTSMDESSVYNTQFSTQYSISSQSSGSMASGMSGSMASMIQGDSFSISDKRLIKNQSKIKVNLFSQNTLKNQKLEQLNEMLYSFEKSCLPSMPKLLTIGQPVYSDDIFKLESSWKDIVKDYQSLTKDQMDQQEALWELLQTEVNYIRKVKVIIDLFQSCLLNLQNEQLLNEIETEKIFSNISEIYHVNCLFWKDHLLKVLLESRKSGSLLNPLLLKQAFMEFDSKFGPYKKYCLEQKNAISYISDRLNENALFKHFIVWAEKQEQCKRLELSSMIAMPFQRLTKYKLLLKAISRKTEDQKDLFDMIKRVDIFVAHVNTALHQKIEFERLSNIIDRIDSYDIIDVSNEEILRLSYSFCDFQLTNPIPGCPNEKRHLIDSGNLKLKEKDSKMDIFCFLFTDLILVTKPLRKTDKVKVIKPPMRLDKIIVQTLRDGVSFVLCYLNEYHVANSVVTFHGESSKHWVEKILAAQENYKRMRMTARAASDSSLMYYSMNGQIDDDDNQSISMHSTNESQLSQEARVSLVRQSSNCSTDMFLSSEILRIPSSESIDQTTHSQGSCSKSPFIGDSKYRCRSPDNEAPNSVSAKASFSGTKTRRYQTVNSDTSLRRVGYVEDENIKIKLSQRRAQVGQENRYHTADSIQELTKERGDSSIYKRHSLNFGPSSTNTLNHNESTSVESIRSIPASSSGVSSTLSLHESVDEFIDIIQATTTPIDKIIGVHKTTPSISSMMPPTIPASSPPREPHPNPPIPPKPKLATHFTSKSLNDISKISESIQGITSIPTNRAQKNNYAQIMRMTKELLLNSNIEASEV